MDWLSALAPFAALGFLGSAHCAGMCGPLALAAANDAKSGRRPWLRVGAHALGKALSYAVLGAAASAAVGGIALAGGEVGIPRALEVARPALALAAGAAMVAFALSALGVPWLPAALAGRISPRWSAFTARAARSLDGYARSFGLGLANGLLPCGLSWSAFALASASDLATAGAGCFVFGAATYPALAAVALAGRAIPLGARTVAVRVAAVLVLALGVATLVRAPLAWLGGSAEAACCSEPGAHDVSLPSKHAR
jgi:hypothetical protein